MPKFNATPQRHSSHMNWESHSLSPDPARRSLWRYKLCRGPSPQIASVDNCLRCFRRPIRESSAKMRMAFKPPPTTTKMTKLPTVEVKGRSKTWAAAGESELAAAISKRLHGTVRAAAGMAPSAIMSNPASCMPKNTSSTMIQ